MGGALGAVMRYGTTMLARTLLGERFAAVGTLGVNVVGCFFLGLLMHAVLREGQWQLPLHWHAGLTIGLLGALTTYSTFGFETVLLWQNHMPRFALANVAANLLLGIAAVLLGHWLGDWLQGS